jgi:D-alanyl-D-alanine carboxypeptidase
LFFFLLIAVLAAGLLPVAGPCATAVHAEDNPDLVWDIPADGQWPTLEEIRASAWIVFDRKTDQVVLEFEADKVLFPASTTKIMTAVLAIESGDMERKLTASHAAVNLTSASSKVGFVAGEEVVMRDVIAGLMVASGNDAANMIAESLGGSKEGFAALMNNKARKIGMKDSFFCNPSGLQDYSHVVTVRDMVVLTDYALGIPEFRELVSLKTYAMPSTNKHPFVGWGLFTNTNKLLVYGDTGFHSDYIKQYIGVKTGSTNEAGNNLVSAAITTEGHELICVIYGVPSAGYPCSTFNYSRTLLVEAAKKIATQPLPTTETSGSESESTASSETGGSDNPGQTTQDSQTSQTGQTTAGSTSGEETEPTEPGAVITSTDNQPGQASGEKKPGLFGFLTDNIWRTIVLAVMAFLIISYILQVRQARKQRRRRRARSLPVKPRRVDMP